LFFVFFCFISEFCYWAKQKKLFSEIPASHTPCKYHDTYKSFLVARQALHSLMAKVGYK